MASELRSSDKIYKVQSHQFHNGTTRKAVYTAH